MTITTILESFDLISFVSGAGIMILGLIVSRLFSKRKPLVPDFRQLIEEAHKELASVNEKLSTMHKFYITLEKE